MDDQQLPVITVILGAGASRDVSYATGAGCAGWDLGPSIPSPLDRDFFDLLQQLEAHTNEGEVKNAMRRVICRAVHWKGEALWQSMEKMFYSLHVSAVLEQKLFRTDDPRPDLARRVVNDFLACVRALLEEAHGTRPCTRHQLLLQELQKGDAAITFNYDFVAERAIADRFGAGPFKTTPFGDWFYGLSERPTNAPTDIPTLYKLHGSLNWTLEEDVNGETQNARREWPQTWADFAQELSYPLSHGQGYDDAVPSHRPPLLLPYWEKRVESGVWLRIWRAAANQLLQAAVLIIWGYSLPITDLKARELFQLAFSRPDAKLRKVVVIDPSTETQDRWRGMFIGKPFFRFPAFDDFQRYKERQPSFRQWLASKRV